MRSSLRTSAAAVVGLSVLICFADDGGDAADPDYYHDGVLAGSLKSDGPLPIYDADRKHLWNRLFAAFYIRPSLLPGEPGGKPIRRIEGGDLVDLLAWGGTKHWTEPENFKRVNRLLEDFDKKRGERLITDPLHRAVFQHDLWTAYDFLISQNIRRFGTREERRRRDVLCAKLAAAVSALALPRETIAKLPANYPLAIQSGKFARQDNDGAKGDYLPPGLLSRPNEWIEIEFHQPKIHEDIDGRFITLHTRLYRGRSYFRIFYRFPGGREKLTEYLKYLDAEGVDWKKAAHDGFFFLRKDVRQIPIGTQVALVQFMMLVDDQLRPMPTRIVESLRLRTYRNVDASDKPETNSGVGMNVYEYTLRRRLLFDKLRQGGLVREPDNMPQYRVIFQPRDAPDWGRPRRVPLAKQCVSCHMGATHKRVGVHSIASLVNSGGFNAGAQLGIAIPLKPNQPSPRPVRAAKWKSRDETFRRLLEYLEK